MEAIFNKSGRKVSARAAELFVKIGIAKWVEDQDEVVTEEVEETIVDTIEPDFGETINLDAETETIEATIEPVEQEKEVAEIPILKKVAVPKQVDKPKGKPKGRPKKVKK